MIYCDYGCGKEAKVRLKNGKMCCSKSQNSCLKIRKKFSKSQKGKKKPLRTKDHCLHISESKKGKPSKLKGKKLSFVIWNKGVKGKQIAWNKDLTKETDERVKKNADSLVGRKSPMKGKINYGVKQSMLNGGSSHANSFPRKHVGPNKPETLILSILDKRYPNEWKFTGNNSVWFGDANPDFININGRKLIIEHFGIYWHSEQVKKLPKKQHEDNTIQNYKNYGYETLIIWENELKDMNKVEEKIKKFIN